MRALLGFLLLLSLAVCGAVAGSPAAAGTASGADADHLRRLFDSLDKDHDGQLRRSELRQAVDLLGTDSNYAEGSSNKLDAAVSGAIQRLDSPDVGLGVSETELEQHLHTVLQGVSVADWVAHGLGLPQYAEAFRTNSITVLDLPMLVNDGGQLLQSELKVESPLHRQQLLRAMQRQILGLGQPPGPLHHLQCSTVGGSQHAGAAAAAQRHAGSTPEPTNVGAPAAAAAAAAEAPAAAAPVAAVLCSWLPPADAGQPGMHKYVLQRVDHLGQAALWQTVAELHDSLSVRFRDVPPRPGLYQYRLSAWNVYGRSPYTLSYDVAVPDQRPAAAAAGGGSGKTAVTAPGPVGVPTAAAAVAHHADLVRHAASAAASVQQQQQAGSCRDGFGNSADLCRPDGLVVPYHQQRPVGRPTVDPSSHSFGSACDPSNGSQQGPRGVLAPQFTAVQGFGGSSQQSSSGGVVWLVGLDPNQPWSSQNTPASPAGRAAQQRLAESMRAAATTGDLNSLGASAASSPGFNSNSSQAPATTARLVALLGSAWHSSMSSWLKALANSLAAFLLVVFPICVRLLPVHVLAQAAQVLAWVLHFLPAQLRQRLLLRGRQAAPPPPLQQQQLLLAASGPVLLQESESLLGGSSSGRLGGGTPEGSRSRASPAAVRHSPGPSASALSVGGHLASKEAAASPPDVVLLPDGVVAPPAAAAVAAVPAAVPAAAAGARRRLMPRSVSEFDMVQHTWSASPGAVRAACSATGSPYGSSPVKHSGLLAGGSPGPARAGWAAPGAGQDSSGGGSVQLDRAAAAAVPAACLSQPGVEAAAVGSVREEVERELQDLLQCGAHGSALPDNTQCCFPGCQQQFGLRHWKATMQRHYCGRCQQAFCLQHTVYSPHGASGTCGVQSRCLCIDCFYEYTPEYQAFLTSRNTLTGKRSRSGPPGAAGVTGGSIGSGSSSSSSVTAGGSRSATGMLSRLVTQSLSGSQRQLAAAAAAAAGGSSSAGGAGIGGVPVAPAPAGRTLATCQAAAGAAAVPDADASGLEGGPAEPAQQHTPAAEQPEAALSVKRQQPLAAGSSGPSAGSNSRMLWGRGLTKALGVVRFKHAGDVYAATSSGTAAVSGGTGSGAVTDRTV